MIKYQLIANSQPSTSLCYSNDDTEVMTAGNDSLIKIFCAYSGEVLEQYGPHTTGSSILQAVYSPDNKKILTCLADDKIIIHNRQYYNQKTNQYDTQYDQQIDLTKEDLDKNIKQCRAAKSAIYSKNGKYIYVVTITLVGSNSQLRKYDSETLECIKSINLLEKTNFIILSPDDEVIYIATDQGLEYYQADDLELIGDEQLDSEVLDLCWYRKQFLVVPCYKTQKVFIFDTKSVKEDGDLIELYDINCYNYLNSAAVFDNDKLNLILVGGGIDPKQVAQQKEGNKTTTDIYDLITKKCIYSIQHHGSPLIRVRVNHQCDSFASVAIDGNLFLFRLNFDNETFNREW